MSENLKELLEKINQDGIRSAEEHAKSIELKAKQDAEKMVQDAEKRARKIIEEANSAAEKTKITGELALKQASRDLVLSLKDEIRGIFNKVIAQDTAKAISEQELAHILHSLIEKYIDKRGETNDIKVLLKKEDLERLKDNFLIKLKEKLKGGIELKPSADINAGFSISFDKGKSYYDFTDEALVETLSVYLNPEIAKIIK